jgi:hypothetical protein
MSYTCELPGLNKLGKPAITNMNISSLYVCMAIKYIIVLFVAVINLSGVSTNKSIIK